MGLTKISNIVASVIVIGIAITTLYWPLGTNRPKIMSISGTPFKAVYLVYDRTATQVFAHMVVQSGEAENQGVEGLAHYLEHLTWLNTINQMAANTQRDTNASTTHDVTEYRLSGPLEKFPEYMNSLMKIFDPITLETEFAIQERDVILREYAYRLGERSAARAYEAIDRDLYSGTGYARSVLGTPEQISNFSYEEAKELHAKTHVIQNTVLIVAGNVSIEDLAVVVVPKLPVYRARSAPVFPPPSWMRSGKSLQTFVDESSPDMLLWKKIVKLDRPIPFERLQANLDVLASVLDTNLPGGLAGPLRFDAFIASSFSIELNAIDEQHIEIQFTANPDRDVSLPKLQEGFEKAFAGIADGGIVRTTYDRVKGRMDENIERPENQEAETMRLFDYVRQRVMFGQTPLDTDAYWSRPDLPDPALAAWLLESLNSTGRISVGYIGKEASFK